MTGSVSIRSVGRFLSLLYLEFGQELFTERMISFRRQAQDFVSDVGWAGDCDVSIFGFLLLHFLLHFSAAVSVGGFGSVPCFAKHRARTFLISIPQRVGNSGLSS